MRPVFLTAMLSLVSDGKNRLARTAAATQATTMTQRKRTANRPVAAKNVCTWDLPVGQAAPEMVPVAGSVVPGVAGAVSVSAGIELKPTTS